MKETILLNTVPVIIEKFIENYPKIVEFLNGKVKSSELYLKQGVTEYLKKAIKKYCKIKTLLYRDTPVYLYDFYVDMDLRHNMTIINSSDISNIINLGQFIIITGSAGSGKSTLMKHLLLNSLKEKKYIPLFLEIRTLNLQEKDLVDAVYERLTNMGFKLEQEYFLKALDSGGFILFFDGFDEIDPARKSITGERILNLADQYDKNYFIISSRPDECFLSWSKFIELKTQPLSKDKALELIEKIEYDRDIKQRFLKALKSGAFEKHGSFLSNPLLLTIMLISYSQYAEIPNKIHIFYAQAFESLFSKHDATKGGYKRKMATNLAIDDFSRVFSCFCILSFSEHNTTFDSGKAQEYLQSASKLTGIEFDAADYIRDLLKSVCLLVQDGILFTFTHKTFQEYFTALFISNASQAVQKDLLMRDEFLISSSVLYMLSEMRKDLMETEFFIPRLKALKEQIRFGDVPDTQSIALFLEKYCSSIEIDENGIVTYHDIEIVLFELLHLIDICYRDRDFLIKDHAQQGSRFALNELIKEYTNDDRLQNKKSFTFKISEKQILQKFAGIETKRSISIIKAMRVLDYLSNKHVEQEKAIKEILFK